VQEVQGTCYAWRPLNHACGFPVPDSDAMRLCDSFGGGEMQRIFQRMQWELFIVSNFEQSESLAKG
jgi:hypothetical protein